MLNKSYILFYLLISLSSQIFASNVCPNATSQVDLRSQFGPIRDQDSVGWCYGFTAADLLTHYLYKTNASEVANRDPNANYLNPKYAVSAVGVATFFNKYKNPDYFKNVHAKDSKELSTKYNKLVVPVEGSIPNSIEAVKKNGFCFEKDLPSENFSYSTDSLCLNEGKCNLLDTLNLVYDQTNNAQCSNYAPQIQKLFPNLPLAEIRSILTFSKKNEALERLVNIACLKKFNTRFISENRPITKYFELGKESSGDHFWSKEIINSEKLLDIIDSSLDSGTPVGITYRHQFLLGIKNSKETHISSLVGKRINPKTCQVEYILRNSWGRSCDIYKKENPNYGKCVRSISNFKDLIKVYENERKCLKSFPPVFRNSKIDCDQASGYVFISKEDLKHNILAVTYLDESL
jgi:hypothetical protein